MSDANATDFVARTGVPIFRDAMAGRPSWTEMEPGAVKHDTFVFDRNGTRTLFWDTSANQLGQWQPQIRAAVEALGK